MPLGRGTDVVMNTLSIILFPLFFASGIAGTIAYRRFLSRLRKLHINSWENLVKPSSFLNFGIGNTRRFAVFLWRRDYEKIRNEKTVAFARFLRTYYICCGVLAAMTLAVVVWGSLTLLREKGVPQLA